MTAAGTFFHSPGCAIRPCTCPGVVTEAKAIRNSVEGRDVPRGPSATELHTRTVSWNGATYALASSEEVARLKAELAALRKAAT